jgi:hypothetical protein
VLVRVTASTAAFLWLTATQKQQGSLRGCRRQNC